MICFALKRLDTCLTLTCKHIDIAARAFLPKGGQLQVTSARYNGKEIPC